MTARRRIAITGIGMVTPVGHDAPSTWASLLAGRSGVAPIRGFDARGFAASIGGEVKDFDGEGIVGDRKLLKYASRSHRFALVAAEEALADAQIRPNAANGALGLQRGRGHDGNEFRGTGDAALLLRGGRGIPPG